MIPDRTIINALEVSWDGEAFHLINDDWWALTYNRTAEEFAALKEEVRAKRSTRIIPDGSLHALAGEGK